MQVANPLTMNTKKGKPMIALDVHEEILVRREREARIDAAHTIQSRLSAGRFNVGVRVFFKRKIEEFIAELTER